MRHITIYFASGRVIQVERRWYDGLFDMWGYTRYHLPDGRRVEISPSQVEQRVEEAK